MIRQALAVLMLTFASAAPAAELAPAADQVRPILLGSKLPDVPLRTVTGEATTLARQVAGKPAILVFYRGGWCPYCNLQLSELRLIEDQAKALGYQMIAISPDRPEELAKTLDSAELTYTLLSDSRAEALKAFGIGFRVDRVTVAKYRTFGIDLEKASGNEVPVLPVPSVYIVDGEGVLQFGYSHPDYTIRIPGNVILAAAEAIAARKDRLQPKR
ncbi:MAG TPA: peroxiredoxin-like family protein [Arenimonas sp.]|uniref:peroxiredoxin-like family protein n=1 Tax=Arenimonas sp. TaxID=1872635 RepID=UPI002D8023A2|nr:peroxiredoxin-like family protein [Arenimonas sp.]HEU0152593.1 peroxiredoxin-like family protein [Arenimonas sp.]